MDKELQAIGSRFLVGGKVFILFFVSFLLMAGCTSYQKRIVVDHPGNYEFLKLGNKQVAGSIMRATRVQDKVFYSYHDVLGPTFFSVYLLEHTEVHPGESVLDVGTGSGIQAIFAAEKASHVLAMDISDQALNNTMINAGNHGVADKIEVRNSDLFNALKPGEKFDVIIASIPYAWNEATQKRWMLQERFFKDVGRHLNPDGRLYFITGWLKNMPRTKKLIESNGLKIIRVNMAYHETSKLEPIVYLVRHNPEPVSDEPVDDSK